MRTMEQLKELERGCKIDNLFSKFCDYEFIRTKGWFNMYDRKSVLEELDFLDSPLKSKSDYAYIMSNYSDIVEALGDNLVIEDSGCVSLKYAS